MSIRNGDPKLTDRHRYPATSPNLLLIRSKAFHTSKCNDQEAKLLPVHVEDFPPLHVRQTDTYLASSEVDTGGGQRTRLVSEVQPLRAQQRTVEMRECLLRQSGSIRSTEGIQSLHVVDTQAVW